MQSNEYDNKNLQKIFENIGISRIWWMMHFVAFNFNKQKIIRFRNWFRIINMSRWNPFMGYSVVQCDNNCDRLEQDCCCRDPVMLSCCWCNERKTHRRNASSYFFAWIDRKEFCTRMLWNFAGLSNPQPPNSVHDSIALRHYQLDLWIKEWRTINYLELLIYLLFNRSLVIYLFTFWAAIL